VTAGRREWIGLAVLAFPCLLIAMDASVLELAIPKISAALRPSSAQLLWIMDVYGFLLAGSLITMGALGDRIGRRRLLLIGAAAFGLVSIVAAASTSASMLIAARALLGVAGATLMPSTLSLISTMFRDPIERTRAIGIWVASLSAGGALGPVVGGLLLERFWWGSVFLPAIPVMTPLLVLGPRLLPESRSADAGRLDLLSAAQSLVALLALIYALKDLAQNGPGTVTALAGAIGLAVGAAFLRRQTQLADPLIDLRLFGVPRFSAALATNLLGFFVIFGAGLFMAQYLQLVLGMGTFEAGLWTLPFFAGFVAGSIATPVITRRLEPGLVVPLGIAVAAAGLVVVSRIEAPHGLALLVGGSVVTSLGLAPVFTLATDMIVADRLPARALDAAGVAFTHGYHVAALTAAVLLAATALAVAPILRVPTAR
jgi:MFS transporter, DHA2 family, multidrug resistance protein